VYSARVFAVLRTRQFFPQHCFPQHCLLGTVCGSLKSSAAQCLAKLQLSDEPTRLIMFQSWMVAFQRSNGSLRRTRAECSLCALGLRRWPFGRARGAYDLSSLDDWRFVRARESHSNGLRYGAQVCDVRALCTPTDLRLYLAHRIAADSLRRSKRLVCGQVDSSGTSSLFSPDLGQTFFPKVCHSLGGGKAASNQLPSAGK